MNHNHHAQPAITPTESDQRLILGERVRLRPANEGFTDEELRRRFAWSADANLQYWSGNIPTAKSLDEFHRIIRERDWPRDGTRRSYAILDDTHGLVGMVSCYGIDWKKRSAELGVYIGDRHLWGQGLGTDAVRALVRYAFDHLGLSCISLNTFGNNNRALRSYRKVGFREVSSRRRFRPAIGYYKEVRMELAREERRGRSVVQSVPKP